uniref:MAGE domain-containing protein n=1 Tax=Bos mutus grunniens TaxID=30521 RepID=A0A8B9X5L4_BOSMU
MPCGQKSKHRAREKRRQARAEIQGLHDQATTSRGEETTSFSPPDSESAPSTQGTTSAAAGAIRKRSGGGGTARSRSGVGARGQVQEGENSSQASAAAASSHRDLLTMESENLVQYMLFQYKMRELIKRSEMVKILSRASEQMEMVFGMVLKEVRPNSHCYTLVSNLDLSDSESMRSDWGLPKNGLLMPLLGVIYLNGHRASEEEVWKFLNILGIYDGRMHFIFGDTRKLITEDLVQEEYLEYNQVPGSDPPRYEFLWGPKAHRKQQDETRAGPSASARAGPSASARAGPSASARPGTSAAARAGTSASARADMSASARAGPSASARDGTSAAARAGTSASAWAGPSASARPASARDGTSAAARAGTSASTSAHSRATSSRSSGP